MKVRRYEARTYRDALAQVRDDLGPDAVILTTKELSKGGLFGLFSRGAVEIVAATEVPLSPPASARTRRSRPEAPTSRPPAAYARPARPLSEAARSQSAAASSVADGTPTEASPQPDSEAAERLGRLEEGMREMRRALESVLERGAEPLIPGGPVGVAPVLRESHRRLVEAGVLEADAVEILADVDLSLLSDRPTEEELRRAVWEAVRAEFSVSGPLLSAGRQTERRVVAVVGPTGVGKTTTIAKLAAHYGLIENRRVALLTVDTYRVAAVDQLRTFADIMDLQIEVASTPEEARSKLTALAGQELVLIDTAGRSHSAERRIEELQALMRATEPDEIHLVLSATTKPADLLAIHASFGRLGANRLLFTKLDETATYGGLLTVARASKSPVSYLTNGQKVPEDLAVASAERLADLVAGAGGDVTP